MAVGSVAVVTWRPRCSCWCLVFYHYFCYGDANDDYYYCCYVVTIIVVMRIIKTMMRMTMIMII